MACVYAICADPVPYLQVGSGSYIVDATSALRPIRLARSPGQIHQFLATVMYTYDGLHRVPGHDSFAPWICVDASFAVATFGTAGIQPCLAITPSFESPVRIDD